MKKIDINETLLQRLKTDYRDAEGQIKFINGLDYLEAMVKLFAVVNIAVVKKIDTEAYQSIFLNNFKITPSLGDFKSLATHPFTKANKNVLIDKNSFYKSLYDIFTSKDLDLRLDMADDIIEGNIQEKENKKKITTLRDLFDSYVVNFRNKLKGHGASFNSNDQEQSQVILENLDTIINAIESKLQTLLEDPKLSFFVEMNEDKKVEHEALKVFLKYDEIEYALSPLMIYLECNKFSCKDDHKVKLFFYNDGKASKSYYIDYSYNHYYYFSSHNEVDSTLDEIITYQKELNAHDTSDNFRQSNLLSVFVGREKELKDSQDHIRKNIESNTPSAITIKGKPGIGKSAYISKLQEELTEKVEKLQSYIFYVRRSEMGDDEHKYFYNKLASYLDSINISIPKSENDDQLTSKERLEHVFETLNKTLKEPLLLVIDGLDEFANPVAFLQNFPMQHIPKKLHLVFSTRGYKNILETLQTKLFNSEFDLLNKDQYLSESISITLGKLSSYEVEMLIGEVLTKDVSRGSETYKTIQNEIYEKSEGLPLYIHYISNKLVEFNFETSNIEKDILTYAKGLPQGLRNFYFKAFKKLEDMSKQILYTLYFSHKNIGFESFYKLIIGLNKEKIARTNFQDNYFNDVEIFLTKDDEEKYGFYHLSVKEAIKNYFMQEGDLQAIIEIDYENFLDNMPVITPYQQEQYKETFDSYYYLKKDSDFFNVLEKIYRYLSDKKNDEDLSELYRDNYLTYFYQYIHFSNYHKIVTFEEMLQKDYRKFESAILSDSITDLIQKFFIAYESSLKQDISEIKYAHEFALITHDHDRILSYAKDYEDAFHTQFMDIVWNLEKPKNKKLFKELKPVWSTMYEDVFKLTLLHNQKLWSYPEYMIEIKNTIEDEDRSETLASIIKKMDDLEKALEIAKSIVDDEKRSETLTSIIKKMDDMEKALELAKSIESNWYRSEVLEAIVNKMDDMEKALEIVKTIESDWYRSKALVSIVTKSDDREVLKQALEIVKAIESDYYRTQVLVSIVKKMDDQKLLEKTLEIAKTIIDDEDRSEALASIIKKMDDLEKALEIVKTIEDDEDRSETLASIVKKMDDMEKALEIVKTIKCDEDRSEALASIVNKIDDMEKALELAKTIESDRYRSETLASIIKKMDDMEKALEIVKTIKCDEDRSEALASIVAKVDDIDIVLKSLNFFESRGDRTDALRDIVRKMDDMEKAFEIARTIEAYIGDKNNLEQLITFRSIVAKMDDMDKAFEMAKTIEDDYVRSRVLAAIVAKMDDMDKAFEMAKTIEDDYVRSEAIASIVAKMDDVEKALEIANTIESDRYRSEALASIVAKMDDMEKALEIANTIESDRYRSEALASIVAKMDDIEKALEIANSIEYDEKRSESLASIVAKMDDLEKALEITKSFKDDEDRLEALRSIVSKTNDQKVLEKALKYVKVITKDKDRSRELVSIAIKTDNYKNALKILRNIEDDEDRSEVLVSIVGKASLKAAWEFAKYISDKDKRSEARVSILVRTDSQKNLEKAWEIAKSIKDDEKRSESFRSIAVKIEDQTLLEKVLEITKTLKDDEKRLEELRSSINNALKYANPIEYDEKRSESLASIVAKIDDLEKALETVNTLEINTIEDKYNKEILRLLRRVRGFIVSIKENLDDVNDIEDDDEKSKALSSIVENMNDFEKYLPGMLRRFEEKDLPKLTELRSKVLKSMLVINDDQNLLEQALEIVNTIESNYIRSEALASIVIKMDDMEKALEIANTIEDDEDRSEALASIVAKMHDMGKALDIANTIESNYYRLEAFIYIAFKMNDIEKVKKIANEIDENTVKLKLLVSMLSKIDDMWTVVKTIASTIDNFDDQLEALKIVVSKTNDQNILEKVSEKVHFIIDDLEREKMIISIKKKNYTLSSTDNYLYKFNTALNFHLSKSLEYVSLYNDDAVLRYYGILDAEETQKNDLENIILKLEELVNTDIDPKEKRTLFNTIKKQILDNESLLNEFISKFGDKLEIDDEGSFDDEFSLKTFEKNIELFKVKTKTD